jgi:aminoglycoside phosphotransferase (APT) family kinase protein
MVENVMGAHWSDAAQMPGQVMTTCATIDSALVARLVAAQFPAWAGMRVTPVETSGWDNRSFRVGDGMLARLPSAADYAPQVDKEQRWLPQFAPALPLQVPEPLAVGQPGCGYPWRWSMYRWIEGDTAASARFASDAVFARELAQFLLALWAINASDGPPPGSHNFYRGGELSIYDAQARAAIDALSSTIDAAAARALWAAAVGSRWALPPVWLHGDVSAGNLLVRNDQLVAVIDFGNLGVGDPACDGAIAWTLFDESTREVFRRAIAVDEATWQRSRGWALWKALIVTAGHCDTNQVEHAQSKRTLQAILDEPTTSTRAS